MNYTVRSIKCEKFQEFWLVIEWVMSKIILILLKLVNKNNFENLKNRTQNITYRHYELPESEKEFKNCSIFEEVIVVSSGKRTQNTKKHTSCNSNIFFAIFKT